MRPSVFIIGAGPGAPDLISVRGLRALQSADVVIHDARVHARLLALAPAGAERIDVGRTAPQADEQDAISLLIAEKAREGHVVARLKWGDAFLFDRGGPEALFLREQGVPFEVIPGVPALIAAPAFAGIPISYPGAGDTITLIRGFEDEGRGAPTTDWASVARLAGTIVCFVGPRQVPHVANALVSNGRNASETAAFIQRGSLPAQRTLSASLGDIAARVAEADGVGPGVLVIGKVVGFREHLQWFDNRPLFGRRVLVTRSRNQAPDLVELLELNGAEAIEAPVLRIGPPSDPGPLDRAAASVRSFDWVVFTSTNAVAALVGRVLDEAKDIRALAGPRICAVGPGTASRLTRFGISPDLEPEDHRPAGVVAAMADAHGLKGARVLLPTDSSEADPLHAALRSAGAEVTAAGAYRAITAEGDVHLEMYRELLERRIDAVTFTSANTVRAFLEIYGEEQAPDLLAGTVVATIGPGAADAATLAGIRVDVPAEGATMAALVDGLISYFTPFISAGPRL